MKFKIQKKNDRSKTVKAEFIAGAERNSIELLNGGDGIPEIIERDGRQVIRPEIDSLYLYFKLDPETVRNISGKIYIVIEQYGNRYGSFFLEYCSTDQEAAGSGAYKRAEQLYSDGPSLYGWHKVLFIIEDFDSAKFQNLGANFRIAERDDIFIRSLTVTDRPPDDIDQYKLKAPLVRFRPKPGLKVPITWLFLELTNRCNFDCEFCPDHIMKRPRGMMKLEDAKNILDQLAEMGDSKPLEPIKLHLMGEPLLHKDIWEIIDYANTRGILIELNSNGSLLTPENIERLLDSPLHTFIFSLITPDEKTYSFRRVKGNLDFARYISMAENLIEAKMTKDSGVNIQVHIANTSKNPAFEIIDTKEQAFHEIRKWYALLEKIEKKHKKNHFKRLAIESFSDILERPEPEALVPLHNEISLLFKTIHSWGESVQGTRQSDPVNTYCRAPYEQMVIFWNGDVSCCCTDYEGEIMLGNVFEEGVANIWNGEKLRNMRYEMFSGLLSNPVCRRCHGLEP